MTRSELGERIPEVLDLVGLVDARYRKIKHLSGGMKQKLKLAQALLHNPPILVLDEPMSGLDPTSRWQMKTIIKQLAETNVTIIFSSHILEDVEGIATTIGIINQGIVVKLGSPQELQKELVGGDAVEVTSPNIASNLSLIKALPYVTNIDFNSATPNQITILLASGISLNEVLIQLMGFFVNNQMPLWSFNYLKPSLERVYLKYVTEGAAT